jgi:hypothetical protein
MLFLLILSVENSQIPTGEDDIQDLERTLYIEIVSDLQLSNTASADISFLLTF